MTIFIALLQGVNIGKHKRISMTDLKQIVADLGGTEIKTVANSGTVVFRYDGDLTSAQLRAAIERVVTDHFGLPVPVSIRTDNEMRQMVAHNPYPGETDPKCLHVEFLNEAVPDALTDLEFGNDHLTMAGREIYLHLPNKMSGITYDARTLGRRLGSNHTSRNWNTIANLVEIADTTK